VRGKNTRGVKTQEVKLPLKEKYTRGKKRKQISG